MLALETYLQELKQNHSQNSHSKKESESKCPYNCDENGFIWSIDKNGENVARECVCRKERIMNNRLKFANLPEAFREMSLENFKSSVYKLENSKKLISIVSKSIRLYLGELEAYKQNGKGLFIYSHEKGSGKTRFSASVANELMKKHDMRVKFSTSSNIINEIKATWDKETRTCTQSKLISDLSTTEVLIIDDFGTEKIYDFVNDNFGDIINNRYNNKKITIYTSNYEISELPYDARIKSRVKETTFVLQFPEESVRDYIAEADNSKMIEKLRR